MEQPSKEVLQAISLKALAVPFSPGLSEEARQAIADHMMGVQDAIESFSMGDFIAHGEHN